jgi:hypothetical protein
LSQLGAPHTQNFEIPFKTQESKKFEISFENFQKMLDEFFLKKEQKFV